MLFDLYDYLLSIILIVLFIYWLMYCHHQKGGECCVMCFWWCDNLSLDSCIMIDDEAIYFYFLKKLKKIHKSMLIDLYDCLLSIILIILFIDWLMYCHHQKEKECCVMYFWWCNNLNLNSCIMFDDEAIYFYKSNEP